MEMALLSLFPQLYTVADGVLGTADVMGIDLAALAKSTRGPPPRSQMGHTSSSSV
jgi:hypothetical protein